MSEFDALGGVVIGAYRVPSVEIELPLVTRTEKVKYGRRIVEKEKRTYGEFCFAGDFHYGNKAFSEEVIHAYLNFLRKHKNIPVGLMGDIIECASLSRYISDEKIPAIDDQISEFLADWRPLADRVKFSLWGNHEEREAKESKNTKLMRYMMLELGADAKVPPPQRGLHVVFKVGEMKYGCYVHHSRTNARVNRKLQLRRTGSQNVVSLIAHGHTHELAFIPRTFFAEEMINGKPMTLVKRQYMLATGCFLEFPSYAEAGSYPLTEVGAPIVRFYADNHQIDAYDLTTTYRRYIEHESAGAGSTHYDHANRTLHHPLPIKRKTRRGIVEKCLL